MKNVSRIQVPQRQVGGFKLKIPVRRVSQGFWGTREHWQNIEGNKGTLANFWEQGNKIRKITVRKHSERVWEHGNKGQFWKGTREQGPPLGPSVRSGSGLVKIAVDKKIGSKCIFWGRGHGSLAPTPPTAKTY